jgi:hypothetical protein
VPQAEGDVERAILSVTADDSILVNQFSVEGIKEVPNDDPQPGAPPLKKIRPIFDSAWKKMQDAGVIKTDAQIGDPKKAERKRNELYKYVDMKYTISEYVWNMLTGFLVTSVSYNYILNAGCEKSAEQMKKQHDDYEAAQRKKIANNEVKQANEPKYRQST